MINHGIAGALGAWLATMVDQSALRWILGGAFIAMAVWVLVPDKLEEDTHSLRFGVFGTALVAFFLAETGGKTQIATVALAAQYETWLIVVLGTTLGMMVANVPAVLLGHKLADALPVKLVHGIVALIFLVLGSATLRGAGSFLGF